jgi:hypothetical protein
VELLNAGTVPQQHKASQLRNPRLLQNYSLSKTYGYVKRVTPEFRIK